MKMLALSILAILICWQSAEAASPRVGNGGGVWTCEDRATRSIRWLRFVDLFEAENEFGLNVPVKPGATWDIARDVIAGISGISPNLNRLLQAYPVNFREVIRFLPKSSGLTVIEDAAIRVRPLPETCEDGYLYYGQLANFTFDGRLLISSKFWKDESFTNTERAALIVHEAVYKALREGMGDKNSSRVRQIVGLLFSDLSEAQKAQRIDSVLMHEVPRK
jgi:hypothetical protein